jgi:hypothetical protein
MKAWASGSANDSDGLRRSTSGLARTARRGLIVRAVRFWGDFWQASALSGDWQLSCLPILLAIAG